MDLFSLFVFVLIYLFYVLSMNSRIWTLHVVFGIYEDVFGKHFFIWYSLYIDSETLGVEV